MASEWRPHRLGDLISIAHGFAFKSRHFTDEPTSFVLLTPGNFAVGGGFKYDKLKYFDGDPPNDYVLRVGDLIVSMTDLSKQSDTLGYPALVPETPGKHYLHNQRLGRIEIRKDAKLDKGYLFYLLCSREYRHEVLASATGTTVKHTAPNRIEAFRFRLPPHNEQQAIATVLGMLDAKIELNKRMSRTLEESARAVFKSWFVDFDPVRAKAAGRDPGLPNHMADLFPDSFQDSKLGEIPQGWVAETIGKVAVHPKRTAQPTEIALGTPYIALKHMPRRCIALSEWTTADDVDSNKFRFEKGEILFGKLRPYFHKVGVAPLDGVCSTDIVVVSPSSPEWFGFVLGHVSSAEFVEYTSAGSTGTKMPRTNWCDMAKYAVALPPKSLAEPFTDWVSPSIDRIVSTTHESRTLAGLRDTLLPKLISGEFRIPDVERIVGRIA